MHDWARSEILSGICREVYALRLYPTPIPEGYYPDGSRNKGGGKQNQLKRLNAILKRLKAKRGKGK